MKFRLVIISFVFLAATACLKEKTEGQALSIACGFSSWAFAKSGSIILRISIESNDFIVVGC